MLTDKITAEERIVTKAQISKAAIILDWLLLPTFLLVMFLSVCLPILGSIYSSVQRVELIANALGVEEVKFFDLVANMGIAFSFPKPLIVLCKVVLGLLIASWFLLACVKTYRHFGYELIATDRRILIKARDKELESNWEDVKNVFVAQSLGGKIFGYGNVTVHCASGAVTVRDVTSPLRYKQEFYERMEHN